MGTTSSKTTDIVRTPFEERSEVPEWLSKQLGVSRTDVFQFEVTCVSGLLYDALTKYFTQRAVDVDGEPPSIADRIHDNPQKDEREYPGKLTSLQNPHVRLHDLFRRYKMPHESDEEADLRVTYAAGYGWGKVKTNPGMKTGDQIVIFHHHANGEPLEENGMLNVYRTLVLYAASDGVIKMLNREALSWYHMREKLVLASGSEKYVLYTLKVLKDNRPPFWVCRGHRISRPSSSVILAPGVQESMWADARSFFDPTTKHWYHSHGVPYRRSYLLHGAPGTGKTSTIHALAGELNLKLCFMSLSHDNFTDQTLVEALVKLPKPCILVFEDIDAIFNKRRNASASLVTFSGFLNAIDGVISPEGTLLMMTTNHVDQLDPALLRSGRVDRRFEFLPPSRDEICTYYKTYYPDAPVEYSKRFADVVINSTCKSVHSLATLQQHFIDCRGESAEKALEKIEDFLILYMQDNSEAEVRGKAGQQIDERNGYSTRT